MLWTRYEGSIQGVQVDGDKTSPPTKWWNHLYLALSGWKVVTVFEVTIEDAKKGYRVGYLPFDGKAMVESKVSYDQQFRMRNGHEDCTFFAVTTDGKEVALKVVARTVKDDATYKSAPLR